MTMICLFCAEYFEAEPLADGSYSMACLPCTQKLIGLHDEVYGSPSEAEKERTR